MVGEPKELREKRLRGFSGEKNLGAKGDEYGNVSQTLGFDYLKPTKSLLA